MHKDELMILQMLLGGSHETGRNSMKYTPIIYLFLKEGHTVLKLLTS